MVASCLSVDADATEGVQKRTNASLRLGGAQDYRLVQLWPPSDVTNCRPSAVATVAARAFAATTLARSEALGDATRVHVAPSVVSNTTPDRPTSQHTDALGAAPARICPDTPTVTAFQDAPASVER